jgi:hypothetical protein
MGRIYSTRVAGATSAVNENISTVQGANFHGLVINVIALATAIHTNGTTNPFEIRVYSDNTGSGTTNLIYRTWFQWNIATAPPDQNDFAESTHRAIRFTEGIYCANGLRLEIDALTAANLEVFVLHS